MRKTMIAKRRKLAAIANFDHTLCKLLVLNFTKFNYNNFNYLSNKY